MQFFKAAIFVLMLLSSMSIRLNIAQPNSCPDIQDHECRFWGIIGNQDPLMRRDIVNHLLGEDPPDYGEWPYCLKKLGDPTANPNVYPFAFNPHGSGIGYCTSIGAEPDDPLRRYDPALTDSGFDYNAKAAANANPIIAVGHVRRASSGTPIPNSGNPHPFKRQYNGAWWLFGHNGGLDKYILRNLITVWSDPETYFPSHPEDIPKCYYGCNPLTNTISQECQNAGNTKPCLYQYMTGIVDSELYFIYLLKNIKAEGNIKDGVQCAFSNIINNNAVIGALNFFLTDTETLWGFRYYEAGMDDKYTLYYWIPNCSYCGAIASIIPGGNQFEWTLLNNHQLIKLWVDGGTIKWEIHTISKAVGGIIIPIDKHALLAPYVGLTSTIIVATVATSIYIKHIKREKEKQ